MPEFILGFPKGKEPIEANIAQYEGRMSAGNATDHFVSIEAENIDKAKAKFMQLAAADFKGVLIRKRKIYVASSWKNMFQPQVVDTLRALGHEVYDFRNPAPGNNGFDWAEIDENWQSWTTDEYHNALSHTAAEKGFKLDFDAMKWADTCVMVLPCGRSANTEAGWMKGAGKHVVVYQPIHQEPELMYKIYDAILTTRELMDYFSKAV